MAIAGLTDQGYTTDRAGSHSLRVGGAMALAFNGHTSVQIQKMGHWKGNTFMAHIHEQTAHFSKDMATNMANPIEFLNIEIPASAGAA